MTTCQLKTNLESGFTINREKGLVRKNGTTETYELVQTQDGIIRDEHGNVIGTEVLHLCRNADGTEFVIDENDFYE